MENSAQQTSITEPERRDVLNADDVARMAPKLAKHPKLINGLLHFLQIDKVNELHEHNIDHPGPAFVRGILNDLDIKVKIDNEQVLDHLPEGAFITISNHHFGALDGIILIDLIASRRTKLWSTCSSTTSWA